MESEIEKIKSDLDELKGYVDLIEFRFDELVKFIEPIKDEIKMAHREYQFTENLISAFFYRIDQKVDTLRRYIGEGIGKRKYKRGNEYIWDKWETFQKNSRHKI